MLNQKFLRILAFSIGGFILLLALLAILVPILFEKQVKTVFINELNKNLATEVVIDQENVQLNALRYFPFASITFSDVAIRESIPGSEKFFLKAGDVRLLFNIINLIRKDYTVTRIIVADAQIDLKNDAQGNINYRFWKDSEESSSTGFSLSLKDVLLEDVAIRYDDRQAKVFLDEMIYKGKLSGNFSSSQYDMDIEASLLNIDLAVGKDHYLAGKEMTWKGLVSVDNNSDTYTLSKTTVDISDNTIQTTGTIQVNNTTLLDLRIAGKDLELDEMIQLLPESYARSFSEFASAGHIELEASIQGEASSTVTPAISVDFSLKDGELYHAVAKDKLRHVQLKGHYENGSLHKSVSSMLVIHHLEAEYNGEPLSAQLTYSNFSDPNINLLMNGRLPASLILPLAGPYITDVEGDLNISGLSVQGRIKTIQNSRNMESPPTGSITAENVAFLWMGEKMTIESGRLNAAGNEMQLQELHVEGFGTDIFITATIGRWLSLLDASTEEKLQINGTVTCNTIDLNRIVEAYYKAEENTTKDTVITSEENSREAWEILSGNLELSIGKFQYETLLLNNLKTDLYFSESLISARNIRGKTQLGEVSMNSTFRKLPNGNFLLENVGIIDNMDIATLFDSFDNFGQDELTSKNLKGKADLYIENTAMQFDKDYNVILSSIYVLAGVHITEGELMDYKPLEELSGFVDIDELKHIKFSDMQNQIEISNEVITIPAMEVRSTAMNLSLSGTHTFDNRIDYQFRVKLGEILGNKFTRKHKNSDHYESSGDGGVNIYVGMTGTVAQPVITFNKKEARDAFTDEEDNSGFKNIFKPDDYDTDAPPLFQRKQTETTESDTLEFIDWED
jgi:hypothetical protein